MGGVHVICDLCGSDDAVPVIRKPDGRYVQCRHCGFIYTDSRAAAEEVNDEYFAGERDQYVRSAYSSRSQRRYARVLRALSRYRRGSRLLEIGCNVGGFLYRARETGWNSAGIDPVAACANYAKEMYGLETYACLLEDAPLAEKAFDVVYSDAVFEHLASPGATLMHVARLLRPGGVVYTRTVNFESYTRQVLAAEWQLLNPQLHLSLFNPATLSRFCRQAGLEVVAVRSSGVRTPDNPRFALWEKAKKAYRSTAARRNLRGDRIVVIARKPPVEARHACGQDRATAVMDA